MFVNVEVIKPTKAQVVAVPATAIVHASFGDSVFVIEPTRSPARPGWTRRPTASTVKIARQQFVRTGAARGDFVAITKGVHAGTAGGERGRVQAAEQLAGGRGQHACRPKPQLAPAPREPLTP